MSTVGPRTDAWKEAVTAQSEGRGEKYGTKARVDTRGER